MLHFVKRDEVLKSKEVHKWGTRTEIFGFKNVPWRFQSGAQVHYVVANEIIILSSKLRDLNNWLYGPHIVL